MKTLMTVAVMTVAAAFAHGQILIFVTKDPLVGSAVKHVTILVPIVPVPSLAVFAVMLLVNCPAVMTGTFE